MGGNKINIFLVISFGIFGLTALIFQVVFAKQLVLLFGLTAPAVATVLAVYFSGLALGSILFGKIVDKFQKMAGQIYALLFLLVGIYGISFPFLFPLLNKIILAINSVYPLNFSGFNLFAFLLAFIFLIFPTILIGGSFPVISKIFIRQSEVLGKKVSLLYFVNTFGSVIGAALAGFWLIPAFGNNATIFSAAGLNIIIAASLFFFFKSSVSMNINEYRERSEQVSTSIQNPLFLYILFITGFLALALEVLYTKTLILFIGSSTYAFSIILITFLLGIAIGSWVASSFIDRLKRGYGYFGLFLGLIGFWLFLTIKIFEQLPFWYLRIFKSFQSFEFGAMVSAQFILTVLIILPATFLMGIVFPLGIKLASPGFRKLGEGIGKLYFANTLGGVLGSLIVGFFLLPLLGFQKTLIFILIVYFILAIFFVFKEKLLDWPMKVILMAFFIFWGVFAMTSRSWSPNILSAGVFPYAPEYLKFSGERGEESLKKGLKSDTVLFYKEGLSQVTVAKRGNTTFLKINGKTDASNSREDLEHQILTGALPLMLHPNPKDILMIGLGSGISLGSVTQFSEPENIEMVEIDPNVVKASEFFAQDNHNALADLRVKVVVADGRNYLYLTDKKYDIISSQPSNLWVSGNSYLFTKEFYELAKSRLKNNGLMFQWLQMYAFRPEDVKAVLKTFGEVFPNFYLFSNINDTDIFLIGALNNDTVLDFQEIARKLNDVKIQQELARIHIYDAYEFLSYFIAPSQEIKKFVSGAEVHTDDRPFLEFSAPKAIYQLVSEIISGNFLKLREGFVSDFYNQDKYQGIIKNLDSKDKEKLKNYLIFRQKIIPAIEALRMGNLDKALEFYQEVQKTGVFNVIFWNRMNSACQLKAEFVRSEQGEEASEKLRQKCEEVLLSETSNPK